VQPGQPCQLSQDCANGNQCINGACQQNQPSVFRNTNAQFLENAGFRGSEYERLARVIVSQCPVSMSIMNLPDS
jgi:hypothetical protein